MDYVLGRTFQQAEGGSLSSNDSDRWTLQDLVDAIQAIGGGDEDEDDRYKGTADALEWRLLSTVRTGNDRVFDDHEQTPLTEIVRPGQCTVMQLN